MDSIFDLAIVGGGINGCGCAAEAALRGLSVVLLEQEDLASHTSSASTKLIHGGLRYLEQYEFSLVRKAISERQTLLDLAPYLIHPQPFVLPYQKQIRPAWLIRLGLFFYDHLSRKNRLPKCKSIQRQDNGLYFSPLKEELSQGFLFYDAATFDARLTLANALLAKNAGAQIRTYSKVTQVKQQDNLWQLTVKPAQAASYTVQAKVLINATGPWVESFAKQMHIKPKKMTFVQGSHILVPKLYEGNQAYLLQHKDKRVVFVIPYQGMSMIGTTDVLLNGACDEVHISEQEIEYLQKIVSSYFKIKFNKKDIVYTFSGVRTLVADDDKGISKLSRDYCFELLNDPLPNVTIYSGKLTTYRQISEEIIDTLSPLFPKMSASQSKKTPLPGATLGSMDFARYIEYAKDHYAWLDPQLLNRYLYTYGTCMETFLSPCKQVESLGTCFGGSLYQVEVDYLISQEFAKTSEDILKRRTQLFLTLNELGQERLDRYMKMRQ